MSYLEIVSIIFFIGSASTILGCLISCLYKLLEWITGKLFLTLVVISNVLYLGMFIQLVCLILILIHQIYELIVKSFG